MTTQEALTLAQKIHPLDLVARVDYMEAQRDRCDIENLRAWTDALAITRNGSSHVSHR